MYLLAFQCWVIFYFLFKIENHFKHELVQLKPLVNFFDNLIHYLKKAIALQVPKSGVINWCTMWMWTQRSIFINQTEDWVLYQSGKRCRKLGCSSVGPVFLKITQPDMACFKKGQWWKQNVQNDVQHVFIFCFEYMAVGKTGGNLLLGTEQNIKTLNCLIYSKLIINNQAL